MRATSYRSVGSSLGRGGADCGRANRPGGARTDSLVSLNWQANAPRRELSAVLSMSGAPRRSWRPGAVRDPQSALSRLSIYREPLFEVWPSKRIELLLSVTLSSLPNRDAFSARSLPTEPRRFLHIVTRPPLLGVPKKGRRLRKDGEPRRFFYMGSSQESDIKCEEPSELIWRGQECVPRAHAHAQTSQRSARRAADI